MFLLIPLLKRFAPLLFMTGFWLIGLALLYPLWLLAQGAPHLFVGLVVSLLILGVGGLFYRWCRSQSWRSLGFFLLRLLRSLVLGFSLLVTLVALSGGLWWQALLALLFCLGLFYARIPHDATN